MWIQSGYSTMQNSAVCIPDEVAWVWMVKFVEAGKLVIPLDIIIKNPRVLSTQPLCDE